MSEVRWYFEPSQPQRIISGLRPNFNLCPSYSAHKSSNHKFSSGGYQSSKLHLQNINIKKHHPETVAETKIPCWFNANNQNTCTCQSKVTVSMPQCKLKLNSCCECLCGMTLFKLKPTHAVNVDVEWHCSNWNQLMLWTLMWNDIVQTETKLMLWASMWNDTV